MDGQGDMFGHKAVMARDRYKILPTTVWEHSMAEARAAKDALGDDGGARAGSFSDDPDSLYGITASIFSPILANWILDFYGPPAGVVYDPFAGGGTRAICCAARGLRYVGCELRPEEVEAVRARVVQHGMADRVVLHCTDSRKARDYVEDMSADFTITCPPYYDLEQYQGGAQDLSMARSYTDFVAGMAEVVAQSARILKRGAYSCWVTGMTRAGNTGEWAKVATNHGGYSDGELLPLHHDLTRMHRDAGFRLKEEVTVHNTNSQAVQRVGMFDKGGRFLIRVHETVSVFVR